MSFISVFSVEWTVAISSSNLSIFAIALFIDGFAILKYLDNTLFGDVVNKVVPCIDRCNSYMENTEQ